MKVEKAFEISDVKVQFVSLVDRPANKRQFLITKAEGGKARFSTLGKILKVDEESHYVTGVVYEPLAEDTQGNFMTEDEIRKAAYWFAKNSDKVDLQHSFEEAKDISVVESYVTLCDMEIDGEAVSKGTWLITTEVQNPEVWEKIQKGEISGYSMAGIGNYSEADTKVEKNAKGRGLLKKFAEFLSKGEVKDEFDEQEKSSGFWNAWNALEKVLSHYDWYSEKREFVDDEATIKEALADFTSIVTELLAAPNVAKAIAGGAPVEKSGKKISGKNRQTLQTIRDSLDTLLAELVDENETEETELKKEDIRDAVGRSIKKAFGAKSKKAVGKNEVEDAAQGAADTIEEALAEILEETMVDAIGEAIKEAMEGTIPEAIKDAIEGALQTMVEDAVEKKVDPVFKARGIPTNGNDGAKKEVKKSEAFDGFFV